MRPRGEGGEAAVGGASEGKQKGRLHQFSRKKKIKRPPRVRRKEEAAALSDGRKIHSII